MRYIPLTEAEYRQMLDTVGVSSFEDLLTDIPAARRIKDMLDLPPAMSEFDLVRLMKRMADLNSPHNSLPCFLGAGSYRHFIPAVVRSMAARSEFVTAYTPYQPEISQGSLQAMFEFQTMMTQLTGMPVSNASLYDGGMAAAEAVLLAVRATRKKIIYVSRAINSSYRTVINTYVKNLDIELRDLPLNKNGQTDLAPLAEVDMKTVAGVMIQSPNMLGIIEDLKTAGDKLKDLKTLLIVVVSEALSLAALKPPSVFGADIVCGEAQSLGLSVSFGGAYLGFFTVTNALLRRMPGRVVGMTEDSQGKCGFVNTISTREQHIRREKATSNICTNQALCAVTSAMYMTTMGRQGLRNVAMMNMKKAAYLKSLLTKIDGIQIPFDAPIFNEFTVQLPASFESLQKKLDQQQLIGGYDLQDAFPELGDSMLVCATETNSSEEIDLFAGVIKEWAQEVQA